MGTISRVLCYIQYRPDYSLIVWAQNKLASILFLITSRGFFSQKENNLDLGQMNFLTSFPHSILSSEYG